MLDARRLRFLREVARTGTIAAAADELNFTASAVSQQLSTLESELGVSLLERSARSVRLTDAGRVLAEHADHVLAAVAAAEQSVQAVAGLRGGRIRLASFATAAIGFAVDAMRDLHREHPDVQLRFVEMEPEDSLPAVRRGELDLAIAVQFAGLPEPDLAGLRQVRLLDDSFVLAIPAVERFTRRKARLTDFATHRWISTWPDVGFQAVTELACRAAGFDPKVDFRADSYDLILTLVQRGLGVALVPRLAVEKLPGIRYVALADDVPPREVFAVARSVDDSVGAQAMSRYLTARAAAYETISSISIA